MPITGKSPFTSNGKELGFTLADFWEYQYTNVFDMQEYIAEFLVGKALGIEHSMNTDGWTLYDLEYHGLRIEVKETAYYHSWQKELAGDKISKVRTFDIHKAHEKYKDNTSPLVRNNDVYVFCLNTGESAETANPMCMENWEFYVVPTFEIDEKCNDQKTVALGRVRSFQNVRKCSYSDLRSAVDAVCEIVREHLSSY